MYQYNAKKELIKNIIYISLILLVAVFFTYKIYYKFQDERSVNFTSESFEVTYHEKTGDKISITKVNPVTDSVGLSSKSYNLNIKNNLTEKVNFTIKLEDDIEEYESDECKDYALSKENIRVSIKNGKESNQIYTLSELEDGILLTDQINALEDRELSIRVWINKDSTLPMNTDNHYHGLIKVIEDDNIVAIK